MKTLAIILCLTLTGCVWGRFKFTIFSTTQEETSQPIVIEGGPEIDIAY